MDYCKLNGQLLQLNGKFLVIPTSTPALYDIFAAVPLFSPLKSAIFRSTDQGLNFTMDMSTKGITSNWFLPSEGELQLMYEMFSIYGVGSFRPNFYWSSTETDAFSGRTVDFTDGTAYDYLKMSGAVWRSARIFTDSIGAYNVGDVGPSGGWIFNVDGTSYYECAPVDPGNWNNGAWSDVFSTLVGTTSAIVGAGPDNTADIVNQPGCTYGAALTSNNLIVDLTTPTCMIKLTNGDILYGTSLGYIVNHTKGHASIWWPDTRITGLAQDGNGKVYYSVSGGPSVMGDVLESSDNGLTWISLWD